MLKYITLLFILSLLFGCERHQKTNAVIHRGVDLISKPMLYTRGNNSTFEKGKLHVISKPILHLNEIISTNSQSNDLRYSNKLILPKGKYFFHGISYNLRTEGLHRIVDFANRDSLQIVIFDKDILKLLSAFAWMIKHGHRDDPMVRKKIPELTKLNRKNNLSLTCGPASKYVHSHLNKLNIQSRFISFKREKNFIAGDNGHVLLEVKIDSDWALVDIDNNVIFIDRNRKYLSAYNIATDNNTLKSYIKLSSDAGDTMNFKKGLLNYAFYMEGLDLDKWYSGIMKILIINGVPLCTDQIDCNVIHEHYGFNKYMRKKEFLQKFYGEKK